METSPKPFPKPRAPNFRPTQQDMIADEDFQASGCPDLSLHNYNRFIKLIDEHPFSIEEYIDTVPTFPTEFVKLSIKTAEAIVACYRFHYKIGRQCSPPTDAQWLLIQELENQIDARIEKMGRKKGVFVRLSRRSPKDAVYESHRAKQRLCTDLCRRLAVASNNSTVHVQVLEMVRAINYALRVKSGQHAMEFILKSERVFTDLLLALQFPNCFSVNVAIRSWMELPIESEFRAFVSNRKLTAMCQYCDICCFESVVKQNDQIASDILECFETFKEKLPFADCVVDFAWFPQGKSPQFTAGEERHVWVIEINPFKDTTGASLFDWSRDGELLRNGPFEFRILTKAPEHNYEGFISNEWRELLTDAKSRLDQADAQRDLGLLPPSMAAQCSIS